MSALPAGGIKLERHTLASRQTAELTKRFVARHEASMIVDAIRVEAGLGDVRERGP